MNLRELASSKRSQRRAARNERYCNITDHENASVRARIDAYVGWPEYARIVVKAYYGQRTSRALDFEQIAVRLSSSNDIVMIGDASFNGIIHAGIDWLIRYGHMIAVIEANEPSTDETTVYRLTKDHRFN